MTSPLLKKVLLLLTCVLLIWLGARYLLPIAMPFVLAAVLALAAEPIVRFFHTRTGLPRAAAAGIGVTVALGLLALTAMVLGALLLRQLQALVGAVPDLTGTALEGLSSLQDWLLAAAEDAPAPIRSLATRSLQELFAGSTDLVGRLSSWVLGLASDVLSRLPDSALGIGTWLLSCYMISAKLPAMGQWLQQRLPDRWHQQTQPMLRRLKTSVLGWLTAQLKLLSITFLVLAAGFGLLRFSHWALWAAVVSLLDAMPVLGSAVVLIPWSAVCFLQGDTVRAVGLLGLCAAVSLVRSILEPKLVGRQLGLDPLLTLAAIYTGYRLWGFGGMLLAPVLTVTAVQLFQAAKDV